MHTPIPSHFERYEPG